MGYNINDGRYSPQEVEETFGESIVIVNMNDFNQGRGPDYEYWSSITHPQTGESLTASRGYVGKNNKCYYAEYQGSDGRYYNYTLGMKGESIGKQQSEDNAKREAVEKNDEARKTFSDFMGGRANGATSNNADSREAARRNYTDMMNGNGEGSQSHSIIRTNSNGKHR